MAKLKKRADGYYQKSIVIGKKSDGRDRRQIIYGRTLKELDEKVTKLIYEKEKGIVSGNETFEDLAKLWWEFYVPKNLNKDELYKQRHFFQEKAAVDSLVPHLSNCLVKELNRYDLQIIINSLDEKGLSSSYMKKVKIAAAKVMNVGVDKGLILNNHFKDVIIPKKKPLERRILTENEIDLITEHWRKHRMGIPALIMLYCGLRRGELLALEWNDINLTTKRLIVSKAVYFINNQPSLKGPKSDAGYRSIPIPDFLIDCLREAPKVSNYICPSMKGGLMSRTAYNYAWESYLDDLNIQAGGKPADESTSKVVVIERITAHMMRHTYCSILYDANVDIKTAQRYMGHSDIQTTLERYTHLSEFKTEIADASINKHLHQRNNSRSDCHKSSETMSTTVA